jgi:molecular chaperone DnaK (HSP70)
VGGRTHVFDTTIAQAEFEKHPETERVVSRTLVIVDRAIKRANKHKSGRSVELEDIEEVIATGRTSKIPLVRRRLLEHCKRRELDQYPGFDEKECVSRGACRYAVDNMQEIALMNEVSLQCVGLHEVTNCSYGYHARGGPGLAQELYFRSLVLEGTPFGSPPVDEEVTRLQEENTDITIYQHTGDPEIDNMITPSNRDIVAIDRIRVRGVRIKDTRQPPSVKVEMWIGKDGLLEAEAHVKGHPEPFRLQNRYQI